MLLPIPQCDRCCLHGVPERHQGIRVTYLMVDGDARIRLPHRSLTISIDVIRLQNADDGHQQDADIEPQGPVLDVPQVALNAPSHHS